MEIEDGYLAVNPGREAATKGFNFLRRNRIVAQRAEELGLYIAGLTHINSLRTYPEIIKQHFLTKDGKFISEDDAKGYRPKRAIEALTMRSIIVVQPVGLEGADIIAVRKKSGYDVSQLVVPETATYVSSIAITEEVLASSDSSGKLFGPYGGYLPITAEFVEGLDAVLTGYSAALGLPEPGKLNLQNNAGSLA